MTTNINCSANCCHQDSGKCGLSQVNVASSTGNENCAYFKCKDNKVKDKKCDGPMC